MTAGLAAPGQVLREVYAGSGAIFAAETARGGIEQEGAGGASLDYLLSPASASRDRSNMSSLWLSLGLCGVAGFAVMIAAAALTVANRSIEVSDLTRARILEIDAGLSDVPVLKKEVEQVAAEQVRQRDVDQTLAAAARSAAEESKRIDSEIRQSIISVDQKVTQVAEEAEKRDGAVSSRVDKLEANQAALAAAPPPPQARAEDAVANKADDPGAAALALPAFHLKRIAGRVATLDGPDGPVAVSIGDTVSGLGKVSRIGRRGRYGFVVAGQKTLWAPWSKVALVPRSAAPPH